MAKTKIPWADMVLNPWTGCDPVSEGCSHCYAKRMAGRFWKERKFSQVQFHPERLNEPLKWKQPRRVFVCSMGDFFHDAVETDWINQMLITMMACPQHTFMVLTKRPENIEKRLSTFGRSLGPSRFNRSVLLPNLWLGVSVENQKSAEERIPLLLDWRAQPGLKFVSVEPMLGPVDLREWMPDIKWVICGGETGSRARLIQRHWVTGLRDQCILAGVPFFFKQWGRLQPGSIISGKTYREFPKT